MPATREDLFGLLDNHNIAHKTQDHAPVFTVEQSAAIKTHMPGAHTKNLFLKDKAGTFFLICAQADTQINVNKLHGVLGCKRLSFGKAEYLLEHLGVTPGSVTLFSIMNDTNQKVQLIIDQALMNYDIVNFHPLLNDATTAVSAQDMIVFARATKHEPIMMDFSVQSVPPAV